MLKLIEFKTETWRVHRCSGANDLVGITLYSQYSEVLDSEETLEAVVNLATEDGFGRYLGAIKLWPCKNGFKKTLYFQMSKDVKLEMMNNEEDLPDERVYTERPIETLHELYDQTLSEKKAINVSLVDVYGDKFVSLTVLQKNNPNEYWERANIYLQIEDFMNISKNFNVALADILTQYETEHSKQILID